MSIKRFFITLFIQLLLLALVALFALWNYRCFSFDKGFSQTDLETEDQTISGLVKTMTGVVKVEYYEKLGPADEKSFFNLYIETNEKAYLLEASQEAIDAINTASILNKNWTPNKVTPIPFYVEIIVAVIIIIAPAFFTKSKKKQKEDEK